MSSRTSDDIIGGPLAMIAQERTRQIRIGYTRDHDDQHTDGEIARAAAWYALPHGFNVAAEFPPGTPCQLYLIWPQDWKKPEEGDRIGDLVKAGAMIVAEIERLQRAALAAEGGAA